MFFQILYCKNILYNNHNTAANLSNNKLNDIILTEIGRSVSDTYVLNQDGKDERMDQDHVLNQDGRDERMDQDQTVCRKD